MKKIALLFSSFLIILLISSCDVSSSGENPQQIQIPGSTNNGDTIDFTTYTPPASRMVKHGAVSVQFNTAGIPLKYVNSSFYWTAYEDFTFNPQGLRTGSNIYHFNETTGVYDHIEYSTIEHDANGNEIKRSYFRTYDDSLDRYQKVYYTAGKIKALENYSNSDEKLVCREIDNLGRVTKVTGNNIYWDFIFTYGNDISPDYFSLDIAYYYNTNLPKSVILNEETTGTTYTLTYHINNGIYESAELVDQDGNFLSKVLFGSPITKDFGFLQEATAYSVGSTDKSFLHDTFKTSNSVHKVFRISSDYQFLGTISYDHKYENIPNANGVIPALFNM